MAELVSDDHALVNAIANSMDICDADKLAKSLVVLFESKNKTQKLLDEAIAREVSVTEYAQVLFRGNSLASKMMTVYSRMRGMSYLQEVISPPMRAVIESDASFEIDVVRARPEDDLVTNARRVLVHLQAFMDAILLSIDRVPVQFRSICHTLMQTCSAKFEESRHTAVGGYFFLRYLCPAIVSPTAYNLVSVFPKKSSHRGLVILAKALQNVANNIRGMDAKEVGRAEGNEALLELNAYMSASVDRMNGFFEQLASLPTTSAPGQLQPVPVDVNTYVDACVMLQRHLSANSDTLTTALGPAKARTFTDILARLAVAVGSAESARSSKDNAASAELAAAGGEGSSGQVLNREMDWTETARHPCELVIGLLKRFETIVSSNLPEGALKLVAITLASASGAAANPMGDSRQTDALLNWFAGRASGENPLDLVDPIDWAKIAASIDYSELTLDTCELQKVNLSVLVPSRKDTFCFFLNVYNLLVLHARVVEGRHPVTVSQRKAFFSNYKYHIGGHDFSLDDLFHGVLRGNPRFQIKRTDPRIELVISNYDPRVHFGVSQLNAASPPIRIFTRDDVFQQLLWAARVYCNLEVSANPEKRTITLPKIFDLYTDFGAFKTDVWAVLGIWLSDAMRESLTAFLKTGKHKILYKDMDYSVRIPVFATTEDKTAFAAHQSMMASAASSSSRRGSEVPTPLTASLAAAGSSEDDTVAGPPIDLDELWVLNVDQEWHDAVRSAVEVSIDLLTNIGRLCRTFMFGWSSVAGSQQFKDYMLVAGELQRINFATLSIPDRVAFFINVYHCLITHLYVMFGPPTSLFSRKSFFKKYKYNLGGFSFSLDDILYGILLSNKKGHFKKNDPRCVLSIPIESFDPRLHFACSTLAKSAGPVRIYRGRTLDADLAEQTSVVLQQALEIKPEKTKIYLSCIIEANLSDFVDKKDDAYNWAEPYVF